MNFLSIFIIAVILITLTLNYTLSMLADFLNLGMLKNELPEEFNGLYDADRYHRSQTYLRANTHFGWLTSTFNLFVILGMWFGKGFPLLDQWVRAWNQGPLISGLIYIGILALTKSILSLPFSIYETFVIEERFGFNQTSVSTFIMDILKGLLLATLLGCILLSGILAFFEYAGAHAWWFCWLTATLFSLALQYIVPTWIMPFFNQFTPLAESELRKALMAYASSIDFPLENIFVMDGSKRSAKSNAFFTGFGKHKRIVLFDTLIAQHSVAELVAILAHEMGHYKKKHILRGMIIGSIHMGILFFLLSIFISWQPLFDAFYMQQQSVYAGLIFFGMLHSPLDFFIGIFMQMLSRRNEYEADRFAVMTTRNPKAMADALKRLSVNNLSNLRPHPLYVFLNYSHPPILQRLQAIES